MEHPPKNPEQAIVKKIFELPEGKTIEQEMDPQTGKILSLVKKDAQGNILEFFNVEQQAAARLYDTARTSARKKRTRPGDKTMQTSWERLPSTKDARNNTTTERWCNVSAGLFREIIYKRDNQGLLQYTETDAEGRVTHFVNPEGMSPSDLWEKLEQAHLGTIDLEQIEKKQNQPGSKPN